MEGFIQDGVYKVVHRSFSGLECTEMQVRQVGWSTKRPWDREADKMPIWRKDKIAEIGKAEYVVFDRGRFLPHELNHQSTLEPVNTSAGV
jgi:hypothetical protein